MIDKSAAATTELTEKTGRRAFIRKSALTALLAPIAATTLAACDSAREADAAVSTAAPPPPPPKSAREAAEEMDRMHEAGIKAFPAKTAGKGNQLLAPTL